MAKERPSRGDLRAIVDMGSNGIRCSVTDLAPPTARILPTLYADRAAISLFDAQYIRGAKVPIPVETIRIVVATLLRFKTTCCDFGVPDANVRVLATEATREAVNSWDFRNEIKRRTGWEVELLYKEEEGRIGAMGIASSLPGVNGLVMDLGGGSTQLSWVYTGRGGGSGDVRTDPKGSVSLPYGAAALSERIQYAERLGDAALRQLKQELLESMRNAYAALNIPPELAEYARNKNGFSLYLSGGGFRGWGHVLMSQHRLAPYPIPIINGFKVNPYDFRNVAAVQSAVGESISSDTKIFRVSQRRASQVPAVAFLVAALTEALPQIKDVRFCQGGVREGALFAVLEPKIRAQHPLAVGTQAHAPVSVQRLARILVAAVPARYKPALVAQIVALANMLYYHAPLTKDVQAAAALRCTTTGVLAGVHGLDHRDRAMLALALCERWSAKLSPADAEFCTKLQDVAGRDGAWWGKYVGRLGALVGKVYPAAVVDEERPRVVVEGEMGPVGKDRAEGIVLRVELCGVEGLGAGEWWRVYDEEIEELEKVGKKKAWVDGWGLKIKVNVV